MIIQGWISMTKTKKVVAFPWPKHTGTRTQEQPDETEVGQMLSLILKGQKTHFSSLLSNPTYQN